jgi:uncharacterized membrane protein HdeD (DUF308 family)
MATHGMPGFFTSMRRTFLLHGLASLAFGILAFAYPQITRDLVLMFFGIFALVGGLAGLWGFFRGSAEGKSVTSLLTALAGIVAGIVCLLFPAFALIYVLMLIGLWNVAAGLLQMIGGFALRKEMKEGWFIALAGLLGVCLGLLIMFYPADAATSIIWLIAGTAVLVGAVLVLFALRLGNVAKQLAKA